MFRTTLLLAVLATLFVIAFKGPDQTALQFAGEIGGKARAMLPRTPTPPAATPHRPAFQAAGESEPGVLDAWDDLDRRMREAFGADETAPPPPLASAPAARDDAPAEAGEPSAVAAQPAAPRPERQPAHARVPAPALRIIEVPERARPPSVAATPGVPTNLRELERYYENASRLLAEIQ